MPGPLVFRSSAALAELKAAPEVPAPPKDDSIEALAVLTAEPPASASRRWTGWAGYRRSLVARVSGRSKTSVGVAQPRRATAVSYRSTAALAALSSGRTEADRPWAAERVARTSRPMADAPRRGHSGEADSRTPLSRHSVADEQSAGTDRHKPPRRHTTGVDRTQRYRGLAAPTKVG
jgi:hypothetical protein